jgi:cytoskeleton protein RodZ
MSRESVGKKLSQAREAQKVSLEQISQATHIKLRHLQAIDVGNFEGIPSLTQVRGFIRAYAGFLKIDPEPLLEELEHDGTTNPADATTEITQEVIGESSGKQPAINQRRNAKQREVDRQNANHQGTVRIPPSPETSQSDSTFQRLCHEIGAQLHRQREILGLSLDDVERHTHLRQHFLLILESGELDRLPSPVQGRGMLSNYATFLGLDPEPILLRYAEALQVRLSGRQKTSGQRARTNGQEAVNKPESMSSASATTGRHRFLSNDLIIGSAIAIFMIAFVIWGALRIMQLSSSDIPAPTAPSIAEVLLASPTGENILTATSTSTAPAAVIPGSEVENLEETPALLPTTEGVQVIISVYQRALVTVTVDGEQVFYGRVIPGSAYTYSGKQSIEILTSNGAGLQILYNGQDQGVMGQFGQVVYRIYTPAGIITPTPTITITPTPTEIPTATQQPTQTVSPNLPTPPTQPPLP